MTGVRRTVSATTHARSSPGASHATNIYTNDHVVNSGMVRRSSGSHTSITWLAAALPFGAIGAVCVVGGGLVAAVTAAAPAAHGAWTAAYLVLVAGVAQITLGVGQAWLAPVTPSRRILQAELIAWNTGNSAVVLGTLAEVTPLVDLGGVLLVLGLVLLARGVHGGPRRHGPGLLGYRLLVGVLLVSIPFGLVLARVSDT